MDRISANTSFSVRHRLRENGLARLISDLLNPLFLPPVVLGLISWLLHLSGPAIGWVVGTSLIFYSVIPLLAAFYLLSKNHICSLDLPQRKTRNKLFLISISSASAAFLSISLMSFAFSPILTAIALTFLLNLLVGFLINLKWKISIHAAALTSAGAIFLFFSQTGVIALSISNIFSLTILLVLLPLIIWARLHLRVHSMAELFGGALSGFTLTTLELSMLTKIW